MYTALCRTIDTPAGYIEYCRKRVDGYCRRHYTARGAYRIRYRVYACYPRTYLTA